MQNAGALAPGSRLGGRYELAAPVGAGGMGEVWLAEYVGRFGFRRRVALKTILPELAQDPHQKKALLDEALVTARVEHVNVVQVLDIDEDAGILFMVTEWIDGPSLSKLRSDAERGGDGLDWRQALRVVADAKPGKPAQKPAP